MNAKPPTDGTSKPNKNLCFRYAQIKYIKNLVTKHKNNPEGLIKLYALTKKYKHAEIQAEIKKILKEKIPKITDGYYLGACVETAQNCSCYEDLTIIFISTTISCRPPVK